MPSHGPVARVYSKVCANGQDHHPALHLHYGPIDLIVECDATDTERQRLFELAEDWFKPVLQSLVDELSQLRQTLSSAGRLPVRGDIGRRMVSACQPYRALHVTPMAAVAGAVADDCLAHLTASTTATRIWINNGGDIALWLSPESSFAVGMMADPLDLNHDGMVRLDASSGVQGIATSGRATRVALQDNLQDRPINTALTTGTGGRSFSLGIADAVTVLADSAAEADVAATLIANAVDIDGHPAIARERASAIDPDSDLGDRLVVTRVSTKDLSADDSEQAVQHGVALAEQFCAQSLIKAASIRFNGCYRSVMHQLTAGHIALLP